MKNSHTIVPEIIAGGIVNGKAIDLIQPISSPEAKKAGLSGKVNVLVTIDEEGIVTSASVISGHPLLKKAAEEAARQTKFSQTQLLGQRVKVKGIVVYNFNH